MQTTDDTEAGKNFAHRILAELQSLRVHMSGLREQIAVVQDVQNESTTKINFLNDCATALLTSPAGGDETSMQAVMRLMEAVVSGTEVTRRQLEALNAGLFDSRLNSALRAAILDS